MSFGEIPELDFRPKLKDLSDQLEAAIKENTSLWEMDPECLETLAKQFKAYIITRAEFLKDETLFYNNLQIMFNARDEIIESLQLLKECSGRFKPSKGLADQIIEEANKAMDLKNDPYLQKRIKICFQENINFGVRSFESGE